MCVTFRTDRFEIGCKIVVQSHGSMHGRELSGSKLVWARTKKIQIFKLTAVTCNISIFESSAFLKRDHIFNIDAVMGMYFVTPWSKLNSDLSRLICRHHRYFFCVRRSYLAGMKQTYLITYTTTRK